MKALIDTNILFYSIERSDARKYEIAAKIVKDAFVNGAFISLQNIGELCFRAKRNFKLSENVEATKKLVDGIIKSTKWSKVAYNEKTMLNVISNDRKEFDFWDLVLYFTMLENGVTQIITENEADFKKFNGIEVINPFKS